MVHIVKFMAFPLVTHGCDRWIIKTSEHWRTDVFKLWCQRRLLKVPWTTKEIKLVHLKGNQSWIFIGKINVEVEVPILWAQDAKSQNIRKDSDAGKIEGKRRRGQQDEMVGWHGCLNGHEFEQSQRDREEQGSLVCCSSWSLSQTWVSDWITTTKSCFTLKYLRLLSMKLIVTTLYFRKSMQKANISLINFKIYNSYKCFL